MGRAAAPIYTFTPSGSGIRDAQGAPRASFCSIHAIPILPNPSSTSSSSSTKKFQHFIHTLPVHFKRGDVVYLRTSSGRPDVAVLTDFVVWDDEEIAGSTRAAIFVSARVFLRGSDLAASTSRAMGNLIDEHELFYPQTAPAIARTLGRPSKRPADLLGHAPICNSFKECQARLAEAPTPPIEPKSSKGRRPKAAPTPSVLFVERAVDVQRGVFWSLDWEEVRKRGVEGKGWELVEKDGSALKDAGLRPQELKEMEEKNPKRTAELPQTPRRRAVVSREGSARSSSSKVTPKKRTPAGRARTTLSTPTRRKRAATPDEATSDSGASNHSDDEAGGSADGYKSSSTNESSVDMDAAVSDAEDESEEDDDEEYEGRDNLILERHRKRRASKTSRAVPRTPVRRRALGGVIDTPTRSQTSTPNVTPRRKRILEVHSATTSFATLPARAPQLKELSKEDLSKLSAHTRARRLLHVGATPEQLPCRQEEFEEVLSYVEDAVQDGIGGCVYVAGVPGTGKTATVREVVRHLTKRADAGQISPFNFVEINGMKLPDASQAYPLLWAAVGGGKDPNIGHKAALKHLGTHFESGRGAARATTVVLMDELDQLVTSKQEVVYNFFNWPSMRGSRLIVLAVANTMDLPERTLSAKVASRLGLTRIPFEPYRANQLAEIVQSRLGMLPDQLQDQEHGLGCEKVMSKAAIEYASKRIANVSGDARRMLDVCRRGVELVETRYLGSSSSGTGISDQSTTLPAPPVQPADMIEILSALVKSGKVAHIRSVSLHAKILLISLLSVLRRLGLVEVSTSDVLAHHRALCGMHGITRNAGLPPLRATLSKSTTTPLAASTVTSFTMDELDSPLTSLCALGLAVAVGSGAAPGRAGSMARLMLACQEDEVKLALEQDPDERLRKML
ncbi:p-loop containing nucleoside triphosphate hydrolase protein [Ceraceosorus bombacis]|uniref:Origin recognition complex subunit 1 n=1 Tax=Ceraceosorus bombacis TaxID=401625 RepID=A0A0P1B9R3_9BASI|nr:p-loop containing nucleoside triphosphate hydrolase protein [Ceraceosorus bombacis]